MKKIVISQDETDKILTRARECYPKEACGLIAGELTENGDALIKKVYLLENTDHAEDHFTMDPKEQLAAVKDMRANGLVQIGNWHSHPASLSRPSEEDIRLAYDRGATYMIISLMKEDHPVLNAYHIEQDKHLVQYETIVISDAASDAAPASPVTVNEYPPCWDQDGNYTP